MRNVIGAPPATAAVVQDALTGEILWVGYFDGQTRQQVVETGLLRLATVAMGQPVPVRHLSNRGDGLVIHVEGPSSRRQMDSFLPDPPGESGEDALEYEGGFANSATSATFEHALTCIAPTDTSHGPDLADCVVAFRDSARNDTATGVAETAAAVLGALIDELARVRVPVALVLDTLSRTRSV